MRSDKNVYILVQLAIRDGQDDALKAISEELVSATAKEEGMLNYEWSLSEDGKTCHVLERYADSDAVRVHLEAFAAFGERFFAIVEPVSVEIYGSPDAQARQALAEISGGLAKFNQPYGGFVR